MDPGATGAECTLDDLLPGQRSSDHYTANSYITPGPGAPTADCGRDKPRFRALYQFPGRCVAASFRHRFPLPIDLQSSFLQRRSSTLSIAWRSAPHCLNCPARKSGIASLSYRIVGTAFQTLVVLFSPPIVYQSEVFWVVFGRPKQRFHTGYSNSPRYSSSPPSFSTSVPAFLDSTIQQRSKAGPPMVGPTWPRGL
jgi:hypothetical protein